MKKRKRRKLRIKIRRNNGIIREKKIKKILNPKVWI
jgi:hypothetical protein